MERWSQALRLSYPAPNCHSKAEEHVIRRSSFVVALLLVVAQGARAQILEPRGRGIGNPVAWTSLSVGWSRIGGLCDSGSSACWDFGSAPQWRGTLEFPVGSGATVGAAATTARTPLIYNGGGVGGCVNCDADANVSQYLGLLRIGGGAGFHQVIDVSAGMTVFTNFRDTDGRRLGPGKAVSNYSFAVGYGFGYSMSPRTQIMLLQDYALIIGKRVAGASNNSAQQSTLRVGVRFGLGG